MKFYGKRLNSIEELRRERQVLLYAKKHTASDSLLDIKALSSESGAGGLLDGILGGIGGNKNAAGAGMLGSLISAFSSKSPMGIITALAPSIFSLIARRIGGSSRPRKNPIVQLVKEVAIGYIKWKAIQLAYRWVEMAIKANKNKKVKEHRK